MGKGDIRTRRGKIWRRTYGVTRPRRYKTVVKPHTAVRKAKAMKDIPKVVAEAAVKKPVAETIPVIEQVQPVVAGITAEVPQIVAEPVAEVAAPRKVKAKKAPATKKAPAKKAPAAKKKK